jgi:hypothetical protein
MFKSWFERLQNLLTAVTFAEAGEPETARKILEQRSVVERRLRAAGPVMSPRAHRVPAH